MSTRIILSIVLVCLGLVAAILPNKKYNSNELDARQMLNELDLKTYIISVDEMADALINKDPSYLLIDLRSPDEYQKFSLPGAINIPFDSLFEAKWQPYIDQIARKNVFYSNGTTLSSEAWTLTRQKGYKNNYILDGGLNNWFATIMEPTPPESTQDNQAMALYKKRLGARQFFTGGSVAPAAENNATALPPVPAKKRKMVAGGCS